MVKKNKKHGNYVILFVIFILLLIIGWSYLRSKKISEVDLKGPTETPPMLEKEPSGEEKNVKEISEELAKESNTNEIIVVPSEAKAGNIIVIKVGPPSGSKGYENKLMFYPANKNLRIDEIGICRSSYCYTEFEKKYKIRENLELGMYLIKIYDRDLKNYTYGYFTIM